MSSIVTIDYTNHRGERAERRVRPTAIIHRLAGTRHHPRPGWFLMAVVEDREWQSREFEMRSIHSWREDEA